VPTVDEWTILVDYLIANGYNYDGTTTDNKVGKALASNTLWASSTVEGAVGNTDYPAKRNSSGFTAPPGGERFSNGNFSNRTIIGKWWSATGSDASADCRNMYSSCIYILKSGNLIKTGLSVRCIRD
jgi:uncharacterized protein (TIGR02145 family)